MQEMETRIIKIDVENIRSIVKKHGLQLVKKENQINNIYDFEDRRLLNKKGYARIRIIEDLLNNETINFMTTKKLISQTPYKVMDENEVTISDSETGKNIFTSLGLTLVESIKKYRESYQYKNTLIEIDINSEEELKEVVNLLGYTMEDTTSKTIYEILDNEGVTKGI